MLRSVLAIVLCACLPFVAKAEAPTALRVADVYPVGHYIAAATVLPWMPRVKELMGADVDLQYFPAEQLGKGRELLKFTQDGVVDIGLVIPSFVPDQLPLSAVAELPGAFATACQGSAAFWALAHGGLLADDEYGRAGVLVLFATVLPPYQIFSREPLDGLASIKGQKLYSTGGAKDLTLRRLGAVPTRMTTAEVYQAMSRGTIDGGVMSYATALAYRLPGLVHSATTGENFGSGVITYVISKQRWAQLPPKLQQAMSDAGEAVTRSACASFDAGVVSDMANLQKQGVKLVPLPEADHAAVARETTAVAAEWAKELDGRGKPGSAVLAAFQQALGAH
jgi:TRAP-type C4-dicarboxylate transport system substrate-binding protein